LVKPAPSSPSDMDTRMTDVMIGVDVGTTAVKVAAFAVNGAPAELPKALREYPLEQPQPGWQVQEPTTVLSAIDSAIADCVAQLRDAQVLAVALCAAMVMKRSLRCSPLPSA
jgi:gluconokinase